MASATGIPQQHPAILEREPLLGKPGDVSQAEGSAIQNNLITGTAAIAQAGIWILAALVWSGIFSHDLIFFSAHPLLNSAAILVQVQAILLLQPTYTPQQKILGTRVHFGLILTSNAAFLAALIIIEINKGDHERFTSPHAILGLTTYIVILLQALFGVAQYFLPTAVFGTVARAKSAYKYHRLVGYGLVVLELATVSAATQTDYNQATLHIRLWAILVASVLVIAGLGARIRKQKLGIPSRKPSEEHERNGGHENDAEQEQQRQRQQQP